MIFNRFIDVVKKYPDKLALNQWSYRELLDLISDREYKKISESENEFILLDILRAAQLNLPLIIPPKFKENHIEIPETEKKFSLYLYSSGSVSKKRKPIKLNESMLYSNIDNAVSSQNLTSEDKILTVCSLNHTGGINAQSLPGLLSGCRVVVQKFNPFNLSKIINEYSITTTHLVPIMINSLFKLKRLSFNPSLRLVVAGSDCVDRSHVKFFLDNNIPFMINYGLTQAGPIIINHIFKSEEELEIFNYGVPLGTKIWCDYKFNGNELYLKGNCVHNSDWIATDDCVHLKDNWFIYSGRISAGCKIIPKNYR